MTNDELKEMWESGYLDDAYGVRPAFAEVVAANQDLAESRERESGEDWPLDYEYDEKGKPVSQ